MEKYKAMQFSHLCRHIEITRFGNFIPQIGISIINFLKSRVGPNILPKFIVHNVHLILNVES